MCQQSDFLLDGYYDNFNFQEDVDFIYEIAFKNQVNLFMKGKLPYDRTGTLFAFISSDRLTSQTCIEANKKNPVMIDCGIFDHQSTGNKLIISLPYSYCDLLALSDYDLSRACAFLSAKYGVWPGRNRTFNEILNGEIIKLTIQYELACWIKGYDKNDLIAQLVKDKLKSDIPAQDYIGQGIEDVVFSKEEIDKQIHEVSLLFGYHLKQDWDSMTWTDLITNKNVSLSSISDKFKEKPLLHDMWTILLTSTLEKENLLGKNTLKELGPKANYANISLGFLWV